MSKEIEELKELIHALESRVRKLEHNNSLIHKSAYEPPPTQKTHEDIQREYEMKHGLPPGGKLID